MNADSGGNPDHESDNACSPIVAPPAHKPDRPARSRCQGRSRASGRRNAPSLDVDEHRAKMGGPVPATPQPTARTSTEISCWRLFPTRVRAPAELANRTASLLRDVTPIRWSVRPLAL